MTTRLTVYTLPGHPDCARTLTSLDSARIPYLHVDLSVDHTAAQHLQQRGCRTLPLVQAGAATWTGHQPDRIHTLATALARTRGIDQYQVPTDPMDDLQCDSCQ